VSEPVRVVDVNAHLDAVRELAGPRQVLAAKGEHASVNNPAWFRAGDPFQPRAARVALHDQIVADWYETHPLVEGRQAVVLAGPPGAGKSHTLRSLVDESQYAKVDADDFKVALLRAAIEDGSYDLFLKPSEVLELEAGGDRWFPLELASLVHTESSMLAARVRDELIDAGMNIVVDTVLSNEISAFDIGDRLTAGGYEASVLDVEVPYEISKARIEQRWRESYVAALEGADPMGGRWVPSEYARGVYEADGTSEPARNAEALAQRCDVVMSYRVVDNANIDAPRVDVDLARREPGGPLWPADAVRAANLAALTRPPRGRHASPAQEPTRRRSPAPERDRGTDLEP
jgi:chloramphenicol 3-O-phosphotransferase